MKQQRFFLFALSALLLLAMLAGCGAKSVTMDTAASTAADSGWSESPEMNKSEAAAESPAAPEDGPQTLATGSGADASQSDDITQKIIYSGNLEIETTTFDDALKAIDKLVADAGGFVENSNISGSTSYQSDGTTRIVDRYADYTLRVPSDKFQSAMGQAGAIGNVTSSGTNTENITSQYIDQEARRDSLKVQEQRLLAMLEKSEDVETLVALEARLSEVRYEMESIERTLRNWQLQVDYSTIQLSLREVAVYTPTAAVQRTFGQKLADALGDGWNGFVRGMQDFTVFLARSLPTLVVLAVLAAVVIVVIRRVCKRRRRGVVPPDVPNSPPDNSKP